MYLVFRVTATPPNWAETNLTNGVYLSQPCLWTYQDILSSCYIHILSSNILYYMIYLKLSCPTIKEQIVLQAILVHIMKQMESEWKYEKEKRYERINQFEIITY